MTDKELLELAAKAAGIEDADYHGPIEGMWSNALDDYWNPLTDDGDALRLAVKLKISFYTSELSGCIESSFFDDDKLMWVYIEEPLANDPYAATRRAIVRAAAEIGKAL